jgi:hypothetical protein
MRNDIVVVDEDDLRAVLAQKEEIIVCDEDELLDVINGRF